jgi:formate/nitrite transporter FocA (FNT family)
MTWQRSRQWRGRRPDRRWRQEREQREQEGSRQQQYQQAEQKKEEHIEERTAPAGEIVYEAIYREGEHELERGSRELMWSGLAAGLSMGFSLVTEGLLRNYLPDTQWRSLITKLGYSVGFLIVILGRQQLFTKNTLTVMLPLLKKKRSGLFRNVARLWVIVFFANMAGALAFALFLSKTVVFGSTMHGIFADIAAEGLHESFMTAMLTGILAGWLIALMIWLLPFAETARVSVIILLAYILGIGHFAHIVAGAVPAFYLLFIGELSVGTWFGHFLAPVLIGNIIGGVALVAVGAHAEFVYESQPA